MVAVRVRRAQAASAVSSGSRKSTENQRNFNRGACSNGEEFHKCHARLPRPWIGAPRQRKSRASGQAVSRGLCVRREAILFGRERFATCTATKQTSWPNAIHR